MTLTHRNLHNCCCCADYRSIVDNLSNKLYTSIFKKQNKEKMCLKKLFYYYYRFVVISDGIGLPLQNIISPFLPGMDVFSNHVFHGLPTGLLPSTQISIHFLTQSLSFFLITCPCYLNPPHIITVVIGSTPTSFLNSSLNFQSFVRKASSPFSHMSTKLLHCWYHKNSHQHTATRKVDHDLHHWR